MTNRILPNSEWHDLLCSAYIALYISCLRNCKGHHRENTMWISVARLYFVQTLHWNERKLWNKELWCGWGSTFCEKSTFFSFLTSVFIHVLYMYIFCIFFVQRVSWLFQNCFYLSHVLLLYLAQKPMPVLLHSSTIKSGLFKKSNFP